MATLVHTTSGIPGLGLPVGQKVTNLGGGYHGPGFSTPAVMDASEKIYVSDINGAVYIFKSTGGSPVGTITSGLSEPLGTWIDSKGTLYVTNLGNASIAVYPKGKTSPSTTLNDPTGGPISVAVGSTGTVYVSDFGSSVVYYYKKGATSPTGSVSLSYPEGIGIDSKGDVFVAYNDSSFNGHVAEFSSTLTKGKDLGITTGQSGDVRVDSKSDLVFEDQGQQAIDIFKKGDSTPSGGWSVSGHDPYKLALDAAEKNVYIADPANSEVLVYSYPKGKPGKLNISGFSSVYGVAVSPAAPL